MDLIKDLDLRVEGLEEDEELEDEDDEFAGDDEELEDEDEE